MPGDGDARVLVEHERVPGREQRAGQRGDHDRVVDVGDDAERRPPGRRSQTGASTGSAPSVCSVARRASRARGRPGRACRRRRRGRRAPRCAAPADLDDHGHVADRHAREAAPAADALLAALASALRRLVGRDRPAEQHPAEDAHPVRRRRSRCRGRPWARGRAGAPSARGCRGSSPRCARHDAGPRAHGIRPGSGGSPASTQSVMRRCGSRNAPPAWSDDRDRRPVEWRPQAEEVPCRMST